jgi:hypothetical protein
VNILRAIEEGREIIRNENFGEGIETYIYEYN